MIVKLEKGTKGHTTKNKNPTQPHSNESNNKQCQSKKQ